MGPTENQNQFVTQWGLKDYNVE